MGTLEMYTHKHLGNILSASTQAAPNSCWSTITPCLSSINCKGNRFEQTLIQPSTHLACCLQADYSTETDLYHTVSLVWPETMVVGNH